MRAQRAFRADTAPDTCRTADVRPRTGGPVIYQLTQWSTVSPAASAQSAQRSGRTPEQQQACVRDAVDTPRMRRRLISVRRRQALLNLQNEA